MVARLLAVLGLLALVPVADACHVKQVQAVPVLGAQAILVPSYGGSVGPSQQQVDLDLLRRLVEAVERLEARLEAPAGGYTAESVLKTDCAACHTEGKAPKGGFSLFDKDGKAFDLSIGDQKLVRLRVTTKDGAIRMPPERPLSAAKQSVILQSLKGGQ